MAPSRFPRLLFIGVTPVLAMSVLLSGVGSAVRTQSLQQEVDRTIARQSGALVVVDVVSGAVLAANRLDLAARTLARPGSTLKPFVLMELLESHRLDASRKLMCRRLLRIGNVR